MRMLCLLGLVAFVSGCAASAPVYDIFLENATDPVIQVFEDDSIAIRFTPGRDHLAFDLQNKTNGAIEILWSEIVLQDVEGHPHEVCHAGADYANLGRGQAPTVVPARQRIQEHVIPKDHIARSEKNPNKWEICPFLLPLGSEMSDTKSLSARVVGKNFSLIMPLRVGGSRQSYFFSFKVTGVSGPGGKAPITQHGARERVQPGK